MRTSLTSAAAAAALCLFASQAHAQTRVQILHASDLEGGVDAISDAPNFAAVVEGLEKDAAKKMLPSILLSAGDNYIPGPFFSSAGAFSLRSTFRSVLGNSDAREGEGRADITIMNICGFDASCVGNHEFDAGAGTFRGLIGTDIRGGTQARWLGAQFPYLSANLDYSQDSGLNRLFTATLRPTTDFRSPLNDLTKAAAAPKLAPAAIVVRGQERFGIVGGTTPILESITSTGDVTVKNPGRGENDMAKLASILQPSIDALKMAGINKIILVTHLQQFTLEQALLPLLSGVDVAIAGGSDFLLADSNDRLRSGDTARGAYPIVAKNKDGDPALLISTAGQYKYVGRLVVTFDANGVVVPTSVDDKESGSFVTDAKGVSDSFGAGAFATGTKGGTVKTLTDAVRGIVIAKDATIVGKSKVWLEGRRTAVRTQETNMGAISAEANLAVARAFDSTVLVSHKNGGGIRNPIGSIDGNGKLGPNQANPISGKKAGEVSQLDIENSLRFNNGLVLITLTRVQLKAVLEHAVAGSGPGNTPGQYGQFAGITVSYDVTRRAGDRVRFACLTQPGVKNPIVVSNGFVIGSDSVRLVTLDFLAGGGDSYPFDDYVKANPGFARRVDLRQQNLGAGRSTFAPAGSEQDAFAEYMLANFAATPYAEKDNAVGDDQRIQQVGTRPELASTSVGAVQAFGVRGAKPSTVVVLSFGAQTRANQIDLGALGCVTTGVREVLFLPVGVTDAAGNASFVFPRTSFSGVVQALLIEQLTPELVVRTTPTAGF